MAFVDVRRRPVLYLLRASAVPRRPIHDHRSTGDDVDVLDKLEKVQTAGTPTDKPRTPVVMEQVWVTTK